MSDPGGRRIAVVGASADRDKYGNKAVRAYLSAGWEVFPVNPRGGRIEGLVVYPDVSSVPGALDRISVYLQPRVTRRLIPQFVERGADEVWFNPGSTDASVSAKAREAGLRPILGCSIVAIGRSPAQFP
jgi:predicted CoA-binding protein